MKWRTIENRQAVKRYYTRTIWNKPVNPPSTLECVLAFCGGIALCFGLFILIA